MMAVVDAHMHLFKAVSDEYPRDVFEPMTPPGREENAETYISLMDSAGVDHSIIVGLSAHDQYLTTLHRDHPDRFAIVGVIDDDATDPVGDLRRRKQESGLQGLRLFALGDDDAAPEDLALFPLLQAMAELEVKAWFYSNVQQVELLDRVLELLPNLVVVMNHLGFCPDIWDEITVDDDLRPGFDIPLPPDSLDVVTRLARRDSVYVHLSGMYAFTGEPYPYPDLQPIVDRIHGAFGSEKLLMASDYPWIKNNPGYAETLALVDHYLPDLPVAERDAIRGGNAAKLFDFG
jgi:predicted TIM-barrel fold metal-dependent hydrolase